MVRKAAKNKTKRLSKLAPYKAIGTLRKKVWDEQSIYVRSKDADWKGEVACFTCYKRAHWRTMQAGHFHHGHLDYDLLNLKPQCARCNKWLHGNLNEYAHHLLQLEGADVFDRLKAKLKEEKPLNIIELQNLLAKYKKLNGNNLVH